MVNRLTSDVIVVGAGPAGSSTAWHLAKLGISVTLLDRARFPRDKVCAEYLSPEASRILASMGALPHIEAAGATHLTGMRVRAPNGCEILGHFAAQHGFRGFRDRGLGIRRTILDATLVNCARHAGVNVQERMHVTNLAYTPTGAVNGVHIRDESGIRTLHASLIIGADGLRSVVGRRLGLTRQARYPRRIALVAHYHGLPGVTEIGEMHVERNGYVGIADVGGGTTNVALVVPLAHASQLSADPTAFFEHWLATRSSQLADRFAVATRTSAVRVTGPFAISTCRAWAPGAALVGDAADFFDPFTGEGVYAALRGGELLAPFAAACIRSNSAESAERPLREYDRARRAEFSGKWMVERLISAFVATPRLINHAARALSRRTEMADLLIGVAGDFVPPREVLRFGYLARLLLFGV